MTIFNLFKYEAKMLGDRVVQPVPHAANWIFKKYSSNCIIKNIQLMFSKLLGKPKINYKVDLKC